MSFKVLLCCLLFCLAVAKTKRHQARRDGGDLVPSTGRGLVDFGLMILCGTRRIPFDYNGYGCYCGFSGHGRPVDDVDRCCQAHDSCYDRVKNGVCSGSIATYTFPYKTTGCIYCKPPSYYWLYGRCRHALCQCDSEAVQCFKSSKYNKRYAHYDKSKC